MLSQLAPEPALHAGHPLTPDVAVTVRAILAGMSALNLPVEAPRLAPAPRGAQRPDGLLPPNSVARLWEEALPQRPGDDLPLRVGMAVPFGAFGPLDLLAGTAPDVASALALVAEHVGTVAAGLRLEVHWASDGGHATFVHPRGASGPCLACQRLDEFAVAALLARLRSATRGALRVQEVRLTRPTPALPRAFAEGLGAPVRFGCAATGLHLASASQRLTLRLASPHVQETVRQLAPPGFGPGERADLALEVQGRLRKMLEEGSSSAAALARSLGMSERTLSRKLEAAGVSYRDLLERVREAEAERLLCLPQVRLSEVALRLGYFGQSAFNRAFKRWKGLSPRQWMRASAPATART
jgi:AraC-like DNA-binding protein